ncbi:MAG TPA: hypothetical protein VG605_17065 [Puia sp.]|nr:hypothetical protein [Puia sp.]
MKTSALFILTFLTISGYAQTSLNAYKYVLVPERFSFSKEDNQYGLSTIIKLELEDKGFIAFRDQDTLPPALAANKCQALKADVTERNTLFSTNLTLYLKDCQGNTIFKSKEGKSREKEFEQAYPQALAETFNSLNAVPYKYDSALAGRPQGAAASQSTQTASAPATPSSTPAPAIPSSAPAPASAPVAEASGTLYAQAIPNGYQLIDTTPKKVLTLLKTSVADYFIADNGSSVGIVFRRDGAWYFEYYKNEKLVSQKLEIKF